jgi:hypothetical protein
MTRKLLPARGRTALPAFVLLLAVAGGSAPVHADHEDASATLESADACSQASLQGTYGFSFHGVNLKPDGARASEFAGVGLETFDGHGGIISGRLTSTFGGQPAAPTFSGTYSVNADCTGTKTIIIDGQPSHYALVVVDHGRAIETAETDPGTVLAFTQVRQ